MSTPKRLTLGNLVNFDTPAATNKIIVLKDTDKRVLKKQKTEICNVEKTKESASEGGSTTAESLRSDSESIIAQDTQGQSQTVENGKTTITSKDILVLSESSQSDAKSATKSHNSQQVTQASETAVQQAENEMDRRGIQEREKDAMEQEQQPVSIQLKEGQNGKVDQMDQQIKIAPHDNTAAETVETPSLPTKSHQIQQRPLQPRTEISNDARIKVNVNNVQNSGCADESMFLMSNPKDSANYQQPPSMPYQPLCLSRPFKEPLPFTQSGSGTGSNGLNNNSHPIPPNSQHYHLPSNSSTSYTGLTPIRNQGFNTFPYIQIPKTRPQQPQRPQRRTSKTPRLLITSFKAYIPDENDPKFDCRVCKKRYAPRERYYKHLVQCHNMIMRPLAHWRLEDVPNEFDPNNYCASCQKSYKTSGIYRQHLKTQHDMKLSSLKKAKVTSATVSRLLNGATVKFACIPCYKKGSFKKWKAMKRHLLKTHNIVLEDKEPTVLCDMNDVEDEDEEGDKNTSLEEQQEDEEAPNSTKYRAIASNKTTKHRQSALSGSSMDDNINQETDKEAFSTPDINDPNNYCLVCKKTSKSKNAYHHHLKYFHQMVIGSLKRQKFVNPDVLPNPQDPNNYCQTCAKKYSSRQAFDNHLWGIHQIKSRHQASEGNQDEQEEEEDPSEVDEKEAKDDAKNKKVVVDYNDPDFYCRPCSRKFARKVGFYNHIRYRHKSIGIELDKALKSQKAASPVVNTRSVSYCKPCAISFRSDTAYYAHQEKVHQGQASAGKRRIQDQQITTTSKEQAHNEKNTDPTRERWRQLSLSGSRSDSSNQQSSVKRVKTRHMQQEGDDQETNEKNGSPGNSRKFYYEMDTTVFPDLNDPNFLCKSCNIKFETQTEFHSHATNIHKMTLPSSAEDSLFCQSCKRSYRCKDQFGEHNERLHTLPRPKGSRKSLTQKKYYDQPTQRKRATTTTSAVGESVPAVLRNGFKNFAKQEYICTVCQDTYTNIIALRHHRINVHDIVAVYDTKKEYCNLCQFTYTSSLSYRNHWVNVHGGTTTGKRRRTGVLSGTTKKRLPRRTGRSQQIKKEKLDSATTASSLSSKSRNKRQSKVTISEEGERSVEEALFPGDSTSDYYCHDEQTSLRLCNTLSLTLF